MDKRQIVESVRALGEGVNSATVVATETVDEATRALQCVLGRKIERARIFNPKNIKIGTNEQPYDGTLIELQLEGGMLLSVLMKWNTFVVLERGEGVATNKQGEVVS